MAVAGWLSYSTKLDTDGFQKGVDSMTNKARDGGAKIKNIVVGLGITKIISTAINTIENSLDGAISRVDTLNNYPKVLNNLGFSFDDAKKSVDKLSTGLNGLPTKLDSATTSVQRLVSKNNDINKSTDYFLAMNNAILAGGASIEIQDSALEQLTQAYSKGKPELEEWKTLQMAMPGQLKQVAKAMGYLNDSDLYEALKNGKVSMEEFMDTIVKLNKEGVNGLASFEKQAKDATGGIATSMTNMKTAVTRGVAGIIGAIDEALSTTKYKSISTIINNVGKEFESGLKLISSVIKGDVSIEEAISIMIEKAMNAVLGILEKINENLPMFYSKGVEIITNIVNGISEKIPELIPQIIETMITMFMSITDETNIQKITDAGAKLIYSLIDGILASIPKLLEHPDFIIKAFLNILSGGQFLIKEVGFNLIKSLISGLIDYIPTLLARLTVIKDSIINKFKEIVTNIPEIGKNIVKGIWNGIKNTKDWLLNKIKSFAKSTVDGIKKFFGIKSPSKVMAQQVGQWIPKGIAVGIDANTNSIDKVLNELDDEIVSRMQNAVNLETGSINTKTMLQTNASYSSVIQVNASFQGNVDLDNTKVGRVVAPEVAKTIKIGGLK